MPNAYPAAFRIAVGDTTALYGLKVSAASALALDALLNIFFALYITDVLRRFPVANPPVKLGLGEQANKSG